VASKRSRQVQIRLKEHEYRAWNRAAKQADLTLSEWLRQIGNAVVSPAPAAPASNDQETADRQKSA
jgi:hypothetical protein